MTERFDVDITGGRGAVIGDYATVFQTFGQSPAPLSSYIRAPQFRALIEERAKRFVGRDFVFGWLDRMLAGGEFDAGYLLISGEPGIGKTAIAATAVLKYGWVHHFNIAGGNISSPRQFLENTSAQLIAKYGLDHTSLPPHAGEDSGFLSQLLAEAAARAEGPVVVVVDALDEADETTNPAANRLFLPRTLPKGVFFVLTAREEADSRLNVDRLEELRIEEDDPGNRQDLESYIARFVDAHQNMPERITEWGLTTETFSEELAGAAEGNFMYLVHVLPEIARGQWSPRDLPRGLSGYYQRHWREMKDADPQRFEDVQRPVLCLLAVGREPVTAPQLAQWTGLDLSAVAGVLDKWREFLNGDGSYRLYHRSFAEFLEERENLRYYHNRIAQTALDKIPGFFTPPSQEP